MTEPRNTRRRGEAMMNKSWSDLPQDLVSLIARKMEPIQDFLAFRAVCTCWRSAAPYASFDGTRQFPWILCTELEYFHGVQSKNIHINNYSSILKPKALSRINSYWMGWKGWLLVLEQYGNFFLYHVFSQTKIRVCCMSLLALIPRGRYKHDERIWVRKAALSSNPLTAPSDFTLMIIYRSDYMWSNRLALWRPGDENFTIINEFAKNRYKYDDVIFYNGSFHVITHDGKIMQIDNSGSDELDGQMPDELKYVKCYYLVELDGNLLIVAEVRGYKFRVFKFLAGCEWEEMKYLGNGTIFVGDKSTSFWVNKASEVSAGCVANSVCSFCGCGGLVIYNLQKSDISHRTMPFDLDDSKFPRVNPLWIMPTFT